MTKLGNDRFLNRVIVGVFMISAALLLPTRSLAAAGGTVLGCWHLDLKEVNLFAESGWLGIKVDIMDASGNVLAASRVWQLCKTKIDPAERAELQANENFGEWVTEADCVNMYSTVQFALASGFPLTITFQGAPDINDPTEQAQSCETVDDWNVNLFKHIERIGVVSP